MKQLNCHILLALVSLGLCQGSAARARAADRVSPFVELVSGPSASFSYSEAELERRTPRARPEDVASPDAIIRAFHDAVDGPKGVWNADRLRSLCVPNVQLEYVDKGPHGELRIAAMTLDHLVEEIQELHRKTAWYERVLDVHIDKIHRVDNNATLAVAIYSGFERTDPIVDYHGPSSKSVTTLLYARNRWWIVSHMW